MSRATGLRPATKAELKAAREDPRQTDLIDYLQSLPDKAVLAEVQRRQSLGRRFAEDLSDAIAVDLEPHELLRQVRDTLREDFLGTFEHDLRELLEDD
jgi:hypothetical protein